MMYNEKYYDHRSAVSGHASEQKNAQKKSLVKIILLIFAVVSYVSVLCTGNLPLIVTNTMAAVMFTYAIYTLNAE